LLLFNKLKVKKGKISLHIDFEKLL